MPENTVVTGASVLAGDPGRIGRGAFGLVTNFTGSMPDLRRNIDALLAAGVNVTALFGPEHGLNGSAQAGESGPGESGPGQAGGGAVDGATGLPLFDTYLATDAELDALVSASGVDTLVFDMQDIGVRYYTYVWTMYDCMRSAARSGIRFVVLDRPNPLGGAAVAGPGLEADFASFVGRIDIPLRHGLTVGELAVFINEHILPAEMGRGVDLQVVAMEGWRRSQTFDETGLEWIAPSPNMPTLDTAFVFCGTGLFEGTNLSEGRGTTRPFETVGAPYVDAALIGELREAALPGVLFREVWFTPTFHKYAGQNLRGVQLHVTDRRAFDPVSCGVAVMGAVARLYPADFSFMVPGERVDAPERGHAVDRLWGSAALRTVIESGGDPLDLLEPVRTPRDAYPTGVLLYE